MGSIESYYPAYDPMILYDPELSWNDPTRKKKKIPHDQDCFPLQDLKTVPYDRNLTTTMETSYTHNLIWSLTQQAYTYLDTSETYTHTPIDTSLSSWTSILPQSKAHRIEI